MGRRAAEVGPLPLVIARRLAVALLLLLPAALAGQAPARTRLVVYQFTSFPQDSNTSALARRTTRAMVTRLTADSMFEVLGRASTDSTAAAPARAQAQYAIIGSVAANGNTTRADIRLLDIANVQVVMKTTVDIPNRYASDAPALTGNELARQVRAHFSP